jgi:predicted nuclease of restriction endonuclease-like (RecB) superfamily
VRSGFGTFSRPSRTGGAGTFSLCRSRAALPAAGESGTNFQTTLPKPQSDLAQQLIKDPYNFDFLTLAAAAQERDLERGLLEHLRRFLIELGTGFAFVGSQVPLEVGEEDFRLDLLFYHLKLRCFIVIDLLCGRPHNSSSVAQRVMWRRDGEATSACRVANLNAT